MKRFTTGLAGSLAVLAAAWAAPPLPVTDLQIQVVDSAHVRLSWSPITHDTDGQPLVVPLYEVHASPLPWFEPTVATRMLTTRQPELLLSCADGLRCCRVVVVDEFLRIPAGQFIMGQTGVATPEHSVTLTHDFLLGRTEVTNAQYLEALNWAKAQGLVSVVGDYVWQYNVSLLRINRNDQDSHEIRYNSDTQQFELHAGTWDAGSYGPGEAYPGGSYDPSHHPVKFVNWYGAACYCDWRSQMEGLPCYYEGQWGQIPGSRNPYTATGYRLPTEAEWEFAAQHDDERTYPWGHTSPTCAQANFYGNDYCVGWTSPVGAYPAGASALGLQDMAGNVWELCNDWYNYYGSSPQIDPVGPSGGPGRIRRGGSWAYTVGGVVHCATRWFSSPSAWINDTGVRLCRSMP